MKHWKILIGVFALCLALALPISAAAQSIPAAETVIAYGNCGDNLSWTLTDSGTLSISGTGAMDNYSGSNTPWLTHRSSISCVVLHNGVTSIGERAFSLLASLTSVEIPKSIESIGKEAFSGCSNLTTVVYKDTQEAWDAIEIADGNAPLLNAELSCLLGAPELTVTLNAKGKPVLTWTRVDGATTYEVWYATGGNTRLEKLYTTKGLKLTHSSAVADVLYRYVIIPVNGTPSNVWSITCGLYAPNLTITENSSGKPVLTWKAVTGATKYEVWYSDTWDGEYTLLYTTKGLKLTHSSIPLGSTYYYKVRAVDGRFSKTKSFTYTLDAPTVTGNNNASGKPVLTWEAVKGATGYEVWHSTGWNDEYTLLYTTKGLKLTHASAEVNVHHYYIVRAIKGDICGEFCNQISIVCRMKAPNVTAFQNEDNQTVISWNAVEGAETYRVYIAYGADKSFSITSTVTENQYVHKSADWGRIYYYWVEAIVDGTNSMPSQKIAFSRTMDAPEFTVTANSDGKPYLTWSKVSGGVDYEIWHSTEENGEFTLLHTSHGIKLTHSSAEIGKVHYYKLRVYIYDPGALGKGYTEFSEVVSIACTLATPEVTLTRNAKGKPVLTWTKVTGAVKYEIWRSTEENGTYEKIYTTTGLKLTNSSAVSGTTYYYKVRALYSVETGNSAFSAVQSVTVG